jgi:hypothetical protein
MINSSSDLALLDRESDCKSVHPEVSQRRKWLTKFASLTHFNSREVVFGTEDLKLEMICPKRISG